MFSVFLSCLQNLIAYPFSLPILLLLLFMYKSLFPSYASNKNKPPSPPKLPIIGNLHQLGSLPHQLYVSLSQRYGLGKIMLLHWGRKPVIIVSSSEAAQGILQTHDLIFANRPESRISSKIFYAYDIDVAFCRYGEHWRQMKNICINQLLGNKKVQSYRNIREEEVSLIVEKIKNSNSSVVNLSEIIQTQTYDLICRTTFGRKYNGEEGINFKELLHEALVLLGAFSIGDFIPWLGWLDRVRGLSGKLERLTKKMDELLDKVIQEHQHNLSAKNITTSECDDVKSANNFMEYLLKNKDFLPMDEIKALVLDVFIAGTDTTYTLLEWTMGELIKNPMVMKRLQQEVRQIMGSKKGKCKVSEDDLEELAYLKAVLKESLRLHPPAPLLVLRESSKDVKINGFDIDAGTIVFINAWAIHRDPTLWEQPEEYRPERFLNNTSVNFKGQDFRYMPFGRGRRSCPGMSFAMIDAELFLANLIYEFNWKLPDGMRIEEMDMSESDGLTTHKRIPLELIATPYSS